MFNIKHIKRAMGAYSDVRVRVIKHADRQKFPAGDLKNPPETPSSSFEYTNIVGKDLKLPRKFQLSSIGPATSLGELAFF